MTITPHTPRGNDTAKPSALDELRAAYHDQLTRLATERDEARRQARRAKAEADVARADLASLKSRVHELLTAASRHLPDLPALEAPAAPARTALPAAAPDATRDASREAARDASREAAHKGTERRSARGSKRRPIRAA
ncbi:hypothetical protein [Actinomadura rubrisoli]|uniref:Uncharacterized protein n=1 Tax=Actinomadura rubrisoli TaxID=2530368 RepID=A0A4R5B4S4_9ACTN|nr:hypothetical protein [Actinomadura rubrisoli]TDD80841.1 hypothetical protein E1298_25170 [Actinomadura rubrisoli]